MKKKIIVAAVALCLCATLVLALSLKSCSRPPEYSEIEDRFIELVEKSYEINKVLFGEGLPTDERIEDPWSNMKTYVRRDAAGNELYGSTGKPLLGYYYYADDATYGKIIAYRDGYSAEIVYLQVLEAPDESREAVFVNTEKNWYYYETDYTPAPVDRYYGATDPEDYDYVSDESKYQTIAQIKAAAEEVYSKDYLESTVYTSLFTGAVTDAGEDISLAGLSARYIEFMDTVSADSTMYLMQSNTYKPLIKETRIFDFSTAKMVKPGNAKLVNIEIETYLPSSPESRLTVRVTLVLQDGQWYLDSGTY